MSDLEEFEILVLGSGEAGKYLAWGNVPLPVESS